MLSLGVSLSETEGPAAGDGCNTLPLPAASMNAGCAAASGDAPVRLPRCQLISRYASSGYPREKWFAQAFRWSVQPLRRFRYRCAIAGRSRTGRDTSETCSPESPEGFPVDLQPQPVLCLLFDPAFQALPLILRQLDTPHAHLPVSERIVLIVPAEKRNRGGRLVFCQEHLFRLGGSG